MPTKNSSKLARSQNPKRQMGLGACPSIGALQSCLSTRFDAIPVLDFTTVTVVLPVADAVAQSLFGDEVIFLGNGGNLGINSAPGIGAVDTTFYAGGILQNDLFITGYGFHVFGEPEQWSQIVNSITPASGVIPPSPDVATLNDINNGALGPSFAAGGGSTINPGAVEWGGPAQRAAWQFANAYRFLWNFGRLNIVDEMVADVAYFGSYADAQAAGDAEVPVHPYIQRLNAIYAALCKACNQTAGFGAYPITHRRVGSVSGFGADGTEGGTPPVGNVGLFHPTRDFDLAPARLGGLAPNQTGCCNPFRKLGCAYLLERGLPLGIVLEASNQINLNNFLTEISASGAPLNGNGSVPEFDAPTGGSGGFTTGTASPAGVAPTTGMNVMAELTLDSTPVLASQQVQIGRSIFKGGQLKLSLLLKGYEVQRDWCQFLNGCDAAGNLYMTSGGTYSANSAVLAPGMAGVAR
jgi:hypothetical protein